jgi:hypothetical protein
MSSKRRRFEEWFSDLGVDAADDEDLRLKKVLLVASSAMLSAAAVLWGLMYLVLGRPASAAIPLGYSILSVVSIWVFSPPTTSSRTSSTASRWGAGR